MLPEPLTEITPRRVMEVLFGSCYGRENGMGVRELTELVTGARTTASLERRVRQQVKALRLEGWPICGHPSSGYYWATTISEINDTRKFLMDRAFSSLSQASRLQKLAVPILQGQMTLPVGAERRIPEAPPSEQSVEVLFPVAVVVNIEQSLLKRVQAFVDEHPDYCQERLFTEALTLFFGGEG